MSRVNRAHRAAGELTLHSLLEQCMGFYRNKAIEPIRPMKVFPATQMLDAFRYMQRGQHIGKIVVAIPEDPKELEVTPVE